MLLSDLKAKNVRWDLTPKKADPYPLEVSARGNGVKKLENYLRSLEGWYFVVDVWGKQPRLAVMHNEVNHSRRYMISDYHDYEITDDLLSDAVKESGGSLTSPGVYPITSDIGVKLWTAIGK